MTTAPRSASTRPQKGRRSTAGGAAKAPSRRASAKSKPALPGQVVLVLQGGGALGAYQVGVYQALHEAGIEPDWVIGTSIGVLSAAGWKRSGGRWSWVLPLNRTLADGSDCGDPASRHDQRKVTSSSLEAGSRAVMKALPPLPAIPVRCPRP